MPVASCVVSALELIAALTEGKRIRNDSWDEGSYMFADGDKLMFSYQGEEPERDHGDMFGWTELHRPGWRILAD